MRLIHQLSHDGIVHISTYNHGAAYILTGCQDRSIRLWNAQTGRLIKRYEGHSYEVLGITVSPDNSFLGSVGGDKGVFYWDVTTGSIIRRFQGHTGTVNTCDFSFDGNLLFSGDFDSSVRIWDIKSQQRQAVQVIDDAKDSISCLIVSGNEFITGSVDGHVRSYDVRTGKMFEDYFEDPVTSIHLLKDSRTMTVSTLNSTIRLMDRERGEMLQRFEGHLAKNYRSRSDLSHDESHVVSGDEDGLVWAWEVETGKRDPIKSFEAHSKHITWLECHPKQPNRLITASADGTSKIWGP
ncbi:mitogen-activated protein kinase organizer 1 [Phakopsora pachyrhizi]|nr:mitogen-activated protein kinase organizer 1 [Phakopsora pachyrhizi]KAI8455587.1 mitogen-activated protein kinase organizer 1 [Phakopsora pachyrhizi]